MSFSEKDYADILAKISLNTDEKYKKFNESLNPNINKAYGVKTPIMRKISREIIDKGAAEDFLAICKDSSFEEISLQGFVIAGMETDIETRLRYITNFLHKIDNWGICDSFCATFNLNEEDLQKMWEYLQPLFFDEREFYVRFAIVMLIGNYITEEYIDEDLKILKAVKHKEYYVQMAVAWAISICFVRFRDKTFKLIRYKQLVSFIQNKSIQKIRESHRISKADKTMLVKFKM